MASRGLVTIIILPDTPHPHPRLCLTLVYHINIFW